MRQCELRNRIVESQDEITKKRVILQGSKHSNMGTYHKELYAKKDEMKKKELRAAVENSSKTYEEILRFLQGEA